LLGVLAAVGALLLPRTPDGGERARAERLCTHGHRAVEALAVEHHGAALRAFATGIGVVGMPSIAVATEPTTPRRQAPNPYDICGHDFCGNALWFRHLGYASPPEPLDARAYYPDRVIGPADYAE